MFPSNNAFGFRIVGDCRNCRRLIDWPSAFLAYSECDPKAQLDQESYLSAFCFGDDFRGHLTNTGSTKGFAGKTWSQWLWFDIDNDSIDEATDHARRLAMAMVQRFDLADDELLIFYSGSKGFHLGLPTTLWNPSPSLDFHLQCRRFAEAVAEWSNVTIDSGVYDRVRAFRAPNSRHSKTGRYKRYLTLDELLMSSAAVIVERSAAPIPFELPTMPGLKHKAVVDWQTAIEAVNLSVINSGGRSGSATVNRSTMDFIRDGATNGDRHRLLFSAAANLAEFGCPFELAFELLSEAALDSGLPPSEVRRQIQCGLQYRGVAQ